MLRCFSSHLLPQYQFFTEFLQDTVASVSTTISHFMYLNIFLYADSTCTLFCGVVLQSYSIDWKRNAFFKFADNFAGDTYTQELKAWVNYLVEQYALAHCTVRPVVH